nr:MAG TPA: Protein of unknown function (DUF551) [Caudoviricetes sp.]
MTYKEAKRILHQDTAWMPLPKAPKGENDG